MEDFTACILELNQRPATYAVIAEHDVNSGNSELE